MITTILLAMATGGPAQEGALSSPAVRAGNVGTVKWSVPATCDDFGDIVENARVELQTCEQDYTIWVTQEPTGWRGHQQWKGMEDQPVGEGHDYPNCRGAVQFLIEQAANYCDTSAAPPVKSPEPADLRSAPLGPSVDDEPAPPPPSPVAGRTAFMHITITLDAGLGKEDQALGRGGSLGVGYDGGRWRFMSLVESAQIFRLGEAPSVWEGIKQHSTHIVHADARLCYELLQGGDGPTSWDVTVPLCGGFGIGQIRDLESSSMRRTVSPWTGGVGSLSFIIGRHGPIAFRFGLDVVVSLPGGTTIGPDARFYEPGDVFARPYIGVELRFGRLNLRIPEHLGSWTGGPGHALRSTWATGAKRPA